jgi:hypothetical protein
MLYSPLGAPLATADTLHVTNEGLSIDEERRIAAAVAATRVNEEAV